MDIDFKKLTRGRMVRADLPDSNGNNCGPHWFVVIVPPAQDAPDVVVDVVGISTRRPEKGYAEFCVELPHFNQPGGHAKTKLRFQSFAHAHWQPNATLGDIIEVGGFVGENVLRQLIAMVQSIDSKG